MPGCSLVGKASHLGCEDRRFESFHPDHRRDDETLSREVSSSHGETFFRGNSQGGDADCKSAAFAQVSSILTPRTTRSDGGTGRRARLRIVCPLRLEGSTPSLSTVAEMAELVDAHGSGPCVFNGMRVRPPLSAPSDHEDETPQREAQSIALTRPRARAWGSGGIGRRACFKLRRL